MSSTCPICKTQNVDSEPSQDDSTVYKCPECGSYKISGSTLAYLEYSKINMQKISSWVSEQNKVYGEKMPYIDSEKIDSVLNQRDKTIQEKFDCFMQSVSKLQFPQEGFSFLPNPPYSDEKPQKTITDFNHCYISDDAEFENMVIKAYKDDLLKTTDISYCSKGLTFEGMQYIESLSQPNKNSNKIFLAFWFTDEMKEVFIDNVKPAIDSAGFLAERVSSSTTAHDNKISDEIISMIKGSRAVIADCTGNRTAVYYEAGFAMGMKIPVIWTCREDEKEKICFDVNQYPFIMWKDPQDLAEKIVNRLKAQL